jgi:hypothetical protein
MHVEAVVRNIGLAADEPLGKRLLPIEHLGKGLEPMQLFGQFPPERFDIGRCFLPQPFIRFHRANASPGGKLRRRRKNSRLLHHRIDLASALCHRSNPP